MNLLRQAAKPPIWLSESVALFFLGVALATTIAAIDRWTGGNLWEMEGTMEKIKARTWIFACLYTIVAIAFTGIGFYAFFASRHIKHQDVNYSTLVVGEMQDNVDSYMKELAKEQKEEKKRAKEQSPMSKGNPPSEDELLRKKD